MHLANPPRETGQLDLATLRLVIDALVSTGSAEYDPKPSKTKPATSAWIYWKRPEEWAQVIYDWVRFLAPSDRNTILSLHGEADEPLKTNLGQRDRSDQQYHDLLRVDRRRRPRSHHRYAPLESVPPSAPFSLPPPEPDGSNPMFFRSEFYRMPTPLLRKALDIVIKQGKAQVFKGVGEEGDGVKFV